MFPCPFFNREPSLQMPAVDAEVQKSINIQNDQEFAERLNDFSQLPETDEFRPLLAEHLSSYRQRVILNNYRDPAAETERRSAGKKPQIAWTCCATGTRTNQPANA